MPRPVPTLVASLRRLLQQEIAAGQGLVVLAAAESELLIAGNAPRFADLEPKQLALLEQQKTLEAGRAELLREIALALNLERVPTLNELLPHLSERERQMLETCRTQALATAAELERANTRNRRLLDNALEWVNFSLDALTREALKPARYGTKLATVTAPTFYLDSKA